MPELNDNESATRHARKTQSLLRPLLIALSFTLGTCATEQPEFSLVNPDAKTLGAGKDEDEDYPAILTGLSNREVINAGVPRELSKDGLARLEGVLEVTRPALIILRHGGNDLLRKSNLNMVANNIRSMIELAHAHNVEVLLIGVPKPGLLIGTASFYAEVAQASGVSADLETLKEILTDAGLKSDPAHPNAQGYRVLAESIFSQLQHLGAL
jgi:acyl-CoA thioesterase-1